MTYVGEITCCMSEEFTTAKYEDEANRPDFTIPLLSAKH